MKKFLLVIVVALVFIGQIFAVDIIIPLRAPAHTGLSSFYKPSKYQKIADELSKQYKNAGIMILKRVSGKTNIYKAGYSNLVRKSLVKDNDLFELGSSSTLFTGVAMMQLIERGKISLDDPISKYYPSGEITKLANYKGKNYWEKITVKMLLNNTSGISNYINAKGIDVVYKTYGFDDIIKMALAKGDAKSIPGTSFMPSGINTVLLGGIINKVTRSSYKTYIKKHIFKQAGLTHTFFAEDMNTAQKVNLVSGYFKANRIKTPYSLFRNAGDIVASAPDLVKFLDAWVSGKLYKKANTLHVQRTAGTQSMGKGSSLFNYELGCFGVEHANVHAVGYVMGQSLGFQSYITIDVNSKDLTIVLMNDASISPMTILLSLYSGM